MKKLKTIFCLAIVLFIGCIYLVGCNESNPDNTSPQQTTITLEEAESTIMKALVIENSGTQNDNVLEKFKKFTMTMTAKMYSSNEAYQNSKLVGNFEYNDYKFAKLSEYTEFDGSEHYAYQSEGKTYMKTDEGVDIPDAYVLNLFGLDNLFNNNAFQFIYENNVIKSTNKDGFSYSLKMDFKGFNYLILLREMSYDVFLEDWEQSKKTYEKVPEELKNRCDFTVTINFSNSMEITNVFFDIKTFAILDEIVYSNFDMQLNVVPYSGEIAEPDWVTEYKVQNENKDSI